MPKIQAWERLNHPSARHLTMLQLHDLLIAAGYREDVAQRIANRRGNERLDAGAIM